jgi:hypothetical protein
VHELVETLLELENLGGHVLVVEEQRCVAEIDHQLGGVFGLREHLFEIAGLVVHPDARRC